jgi:exocyst complex component 2
MQLRRSGNRFLLSSTTFSPALFLSQIHSTASTQDLLQGLDVLSRSIDEKSASLKVLVESNFERFVRAKATIDNVYTEMKYRGAEPTPQHVRTHSRHASRNSFRTSSGNQAPMAVSPPDSKKKNALTKESEYGVLGIKTPLLDVSAKAEEVWGPALGGREKEDNLRVMSGTVERYKELYEVSGAITDSIKRKDHESIVEEYSKAKRFADDAKRLTENLGSTPPTDPQIFQILLAARVWHDVEEQIEDFKRDVWRRLIAMQGTSSKIEMVTGNTQEQHMELISILLELGVTDNPIWVWLLSRYDHLKNKIQTTSDRSKIEIEIMRRRLASDEKPTPQIIASHLRSLGRQTAEDKPTSVDSSDIVELWEKIHSYLSNMLSTQGILGEILEFWRTVQSFIDGKAQRTLPTGLNGQSRQHHRLSDQGTIDLQKGTVELIDMIRESVFAFFADPPIEDISSLFSPLPPTPKSAGSSALTPSGLRDPRFNFDPNNLPPPSPKRGEAWEKFAFWPPWSNSLSGVHYLAKLLALVGTGASEMAAVAPVGNGDGAALERLRSLVGGSRERCVAAICGAWNKDAENIKVLEDWRRSTEKRDLSRMPANFGTFESAVLTGMQKILYISDATTKAGSEDVVLPPPAKLLTMVRSQFVTTLYKALSGMVENAEKAVKKAEDDWTTDTDGLASAVTMVVATNIGAGTVNASDRVSFSSEFIIIFTNIFRMSVCF